MKLQEINEFMRDWSQKKIKGVSFDDLFQIDGVPLWWFYKRFFVAHVMPPQINPFDKLLENKVLNLVEKIRFLFMSGIMRRYLLLNETRKISSGKVGSAGKKVLFLTYTNHLLANNKLFRIQGVVDQIDIDKKLQSFVLFVDPLSSRNKQIPPNNIYKYCDKDIRKKAKRISKDLNKRWRSLKFKKEMLVFKGKSLWPYFKYSFNFFMSEEFLFVLAMYYEAFKKILVKENINSFVIAAHNGLFEKCLLAAGKTIGVKSVLIQHGIGEGDAKIELFNTKVAAFGEYSKKKIIKAGVNKKDVIVTGPVIYEGIEKYIGKKRKKGRRKILLLTQPLIEDNHLSIEKYFEYISIMLRDMKKVSADLVIKLHPREIHIEKYRELLRSMNYKAKVMQQGGQNLLYDLIFDSDVIVNYYGTAAILEASILDKPSITVDLPKLKQSYYGDLDPSLRIEYGKDLEKPINDFLKNPGKLRGKRQKLIKRFCYKLDGKVSERIAKIIYS